MLRYLTLYSNRTHAFRSENTCSALCIMRFQSTGWTLVSFFRFLLPVVQWTARISFIIGIRVYLCTKYTPTCTYQQSAHYQYSSGINLLGLIACRLQ